MRSGGYSRPFKGLTICGDNFVLEKTADGGFLAAVIDGLGHGYEAWGAAEKAAEVIRANFELGVSEIVMRCHQELRTTRGAAVGVLKVEESGTGEFCGVGNIEVQALNGQPPSVFCLAGIAGHNMRTSKVMPFQMKQGDIYCLMSDGVSTRGNLKSCLPGPPGGVARRIVELWGRAHDDATAVIVGFGETALLTDDVEGA
jgi:negative regulator of sigma-B (phosphoserine phosphatase)